MRKPIVVNFERLEFEPDTIGNSLLGGAYFSGIAFEEDTHSRLVVGVYGYHLGKLHGPFRVWQSNGLIKEEEYRAKGALHGPRRRWHANGRLAEFSYTYYNITTRTKRWSESGSILEDFVLPESSPARTKAEEERERAAKPIIEIDLRSLEFHTRHDHWGSQESDLPPPQSAPRLDLCKALEAQTTSQR
jgi:hypothetical protein